MLQNCSITALQKELCSWLVKEQEVLSISINRTEVKAVVYVQDDGEGIDFSYCRVLEEEAQDYAWLSNEKALEDPFTHLLKALAQAGYSKERIKVVITLEDYAFTECLELPELDKKDLEEALNWEVPEHVPWDKESYSFQYLVKKTDNVTDGQINDNALAKLQQVYIYAVENACVETLLNVIKNIGWELVGITIAEALALDEYAEQTKIIDFYEAHFSGEQLAEKRVTYGIPIATAIAYAAGRVYIDFLPKEDKYRTMLADYKGVFKLLSCVCLGITFLMSAMAYGYHYKESRELERWQLKESNMAFWKEHIQKSKQLQAKEQSLSKQIKLLEAKKILWSQVMKDLGRLVPQGVWLTKVNQQEEMDAANTKRVRIMLQGKAQSVELVSQLLHNLEQSKSLHRVELVNSGTDTKSDKVLTEGQLTSFTLKAELKQAIADSVDKSSLKDKHKVIAKHSEKTNEEVRE